MFIVSNVLDIISNSLFLTGYINGNNTFPMPLDEKEEEKYLRRLKEGDKQAKGILIERNLRLVAHIVKKYSFPNKDVDELISKGYIVGDKNNKTILKNPVNNEELNNYRVCVRYDISKGFSNRIMEANLEGI